GVWRGKYWRNWTEALIEADLPPNEATKAFSRDELLECLALLARQHRRFPTQADIKFARRSNPKIPGHMPFGRLGGHPSKAAWLRGFVQARPEYGDILEFLGADDVVDTAAADEARGDGAVYLLRMTGTKYYKVGHTYDVPRRHRAINLESPEPTEAVHSFAT